MFVNACSLNFRIVPFYIMIMRCYRIVLMIAIFALLGDNIRDWDYSNDMFLLLLFCHSFANVIIITYYTADSKSKTNQGVILLWMFTIMQTCGNNSIFKMMSVWNFRLPWIIVYGKDFARYSGHLLEFFARVQLHLMSWVYQLGTGMIYQPKFE